MAPHSYPPLIATTLALASVAACGPGDLTSNVTDAGPIDGSFAVSRYFAASGFMGDGENPGFLVGDADERCKARPAGADGICYRFEYRPGDTRWAGVFWQFPANNWGSRPGRKVATRFSAVRFYAAATYSIALPAGGAIGESCGTESDCRPGLGCQSGQCQPTREGVEGNRCLVSDECAPGHQCVAQECVASGTAAAGESCGNGFDERCGDGLRCGIDGGRFVCVPAGEGDVLAPCRDRNDCRGGLYCDGSDGPGECRPMTRMGPFNFQVGGVTSTRPDLVFEDDIGVQYFPGPDDPQPVLRPDWQRFRIDLSGEAPETLIGAFMWAAAFPDIDEVAESGPQAYKADPSQPALVYIDDIVFEEAQP